MPAIADKPILAHICKNADSFSYVNGQDVEDLLSAIDDLIRAEANKAVGAKASDAEFACAKKHLVALVKQNLSA
jgi:GR25 family glycosyltransferase involved in LPS biosynthesis